VELTTDIQWRKLFQAAILELDPVQLHERIEAASAAMQQRVEKLMGNYDGDSREERQAILDALHTLRTLRRVEFLSPEEPGTQNGKMRGGEAL
jgi:hypothetical protein